MIENLVDIWLTDATERSYEAAFAQLLVVEGHRVIQGPMHHGHEHGKDVITLSPADELCAYQLKGGSGKLNTDSVEDVQQQLFAAASTAVGHPRLPTSRRPDRVFLVTNQPATGPAQGRIKQLSGGNVSAGLPPLQLIEKDELKSRFVRSQDRFFPSDPRALKSFLNLFLADGRGPLPLAEFYAFLADVLPLSGKKPGAAETQRAISAAAVATAFALRQWTDAENHADVAIGWMAFTSQLLRTADRTGVAKMRWETSYRLALETVRARLDLLLDDASAQEDLVVPDPAEPVVYSSRAIKVCGLLAASLLSDVIETGGAPEKAAAVRKILIRELPYLKAVGEVQAPSLFLVALALARVGEFRRANGMLQGWVSSLATVNQPRSENAVADPYHDVQEILLKLIGPNGLHDLDEEEMAGRAYTLHIGVRWLARRLWRQHLASIWKRISRVELCEFRPKYPLEYYYYRSPNGTLHTWHHSQPTSWSKLLESSRARSTDELPSLLVEQPEFLPFFVLVLPHRFNSIVADLLDDVSS